MSEPHNPECQAGRRSGFEPKREWDKNCCPQHTPADPRVAAAAKAIDLSANTRHGPENKYVSHEHAYRCIAGAVIAALAEYDADAAA